MSTLFVEPFGGIAGDMFLAALLDLGDPRFTFADLEGLARELLGDECRLARSRVRRGTVEAELLEVHTAETDDPPARHLADLLALVEGAPLAPASRVRAGDAFRRIAEAEARVHGTSVEEVHFHEVGAVDSIVDVCGAAFALERLGVERVVTSPPLLGAGTVRCAHGEMPVPAPGTAELLRGRPALAGGGPGERTTPTGAALLVAWADSFDPPGAFTARALGYGAGHREFPQGPPNLLRVQLGEVADGGTARATAWLLEFNLDDTGGEQVGFCVQELRTAGALEAWTAPVAMKKDRPGVVVTALCRAERRADLERVAFAHTPTLGVRWTRCERTECEREALEVELDGHAARVVVRRRPGEAGAPALADLAPEYDDVARLARALGRPFAGVERALLARAAEVLGLGELGAHGDSGGRGHRGGSGGPGRTAQPGGRGESCGHGARGGSGERGDSGERGGR